MSRSLPRRWLLSHALAGRRRHLALAGVPVAAGHVGLEPVVGVGAESAPLQEDKGPPVSLDREVEKFAPLVRDGFFLVPRLATHETAEES